jgi:hypothetical protein
MGQLSVPSTEILPVFPNSIGLTGVSYPSISGYNLPIGDTDLYLVPAGKRALVINMSLLNISAGTISWFLQARIAGILHKIRASVALGATFANTLILNFFIFEAGESIVINVATTNGLNVFPTLIIFDAANNPKRNLLSALNLGNNTVYTCPPNKTAIILGNTLSDFGRANYINATGVNRTINWYLVPNGGLPGLTNQISTVGGSVIPNGSIVSIGIGASLNAGDFVVINTDSGAAGQLAFINVIELPN